MLVYPEKVDAAFVVVGVPGGLLLIGDADTVQP